MSQLFLVSADEKSSALSLVVNNCWQKKEEKHTSFSGVKNVKTQYFILSLEAKQNEWI